jgi:D-amino-acid dehydrogenase
MKIAILGAGVIGTTARITWPAKGTTSPCSSASSGRRWRPASPTPVRSRPGTHRPWAGPGVPLKAIKWMLMQHSPLVIKPMLDAAMWRWGFADAAQLHRGTRYASTRRAWCAWPNTAATA